MIQMDQETGAEALYGATKRELPPTSGLGDWTAFVTGRLA
jgi:hypothetical protein